MHMTPRHESLIPLLALLPWWVLAAACAPAGTDGEGPHSDGPVVDDDDEEGTPLPEEWDEIPACGSDAALAGKLFTSVSDVAAHDTAYATVEIQHRIDVDVADDGCITRIGVTARLHAQGCELELELSTDGQGLARLESASFVADSFCPGFLDDEEGLYTSPSTQAPLWPVDFPIRVPDREAWSSCLPGTVVDFPDHDLVLYPVDYGRSPLTINLKDLLLYGSFTTTGYATSGSPAACAQSSSCGEGRHNGGDGWCAAEGTCASGYMRVVDSPSQCVDCQTGTKVWAEGNLTWCLQDEGASSPNVVDVALPLLEDVATPLAIGQTRMRRFVVPAHREVEAYVNASSGIYAAVIETPGGALPSEDIVLRECGCGFFIEAAPVDRTFTLIALGVGSYYWEETLFDLYGLAVELVQECGDGFVEGDEECDDGNDISGDGCNASCSLEEVVVPPPSTWSCNGSYYGSGDGCDCGCGVQDPDCSSAGAAACTYCNNSGSCAGSCSEIDVFNNAVCD